MIEDHGVIRKFGDDGLSARAIEIINAVAATHTSWLLISDWYSSVTATGAERVVTNKELTAVLAYESVHYKLHNPIWSTSMTDTEIIGTQYAMQATFRRISRLVPEAVSTIH